MPPRKGDFSRELRVGDFIRDELSKILLFEMRDPRIGMTSVTDVRVSRDLSYADVYVSSLSATTDIERTDLLAALDHAAGFMRSAIAKRHSMRTTPRLRFHYDELVESGPRLEALIDEVVSRDRAAGGDDGT